jgi:Family of unknown function (DUF6084)
MTDQSKNRFIAVKFGHGLGRPDPRSSPISHPSPIFFSGIGSPGVSIVSGSRVRVGESRFFYFTEFQLPAGQAPGLNDGDIPVFIYFNGTIFYAKAGGGVQVAQISWDKEGQYRLPVRVWKEMMDIYYPNTRWLCLRSDAFERLYRYKVRHGLPTFEQVMETVFQ